MKTNINLKKRSCKAGVSFSQTIKCFMLSILVLVGIQSSLQAQEVQSQNPQYTRPSWFFGGAVGANFNYYQGTTQVLYSDLTTSTAFNHGKGAGIFIAPLIEYHKPKTRLGFMLQLGYDNRRANYEQVISPCNCPLDLAINLSYVSIEPSLRFAPFKSNFYIFGGPRFAFNSATSKYSVHSFTYTKGNNPSSSLEVSSERIHANLSNTYNSLISMQVGAGIDIPLSSQNRHTQFMLSPFVSFHPYFGQEPRSIETWTVTTLRAGIALKFGTGHKISVPAEIVAIPVEVVDPEVRFVVNAPKNIPTARRVRETFPLRNYVFFNANSKEIPDRYVMLRKDQVKDFKEDQLEVTTPKNLSGRSSREMIVYYNVLNILGDRMEKSPSSSITLVGSSNNNPKDGKDMAESIKQYLVNVFDISASRVIVEGRNKPKIPSEQPGGSIDLALLREGDRRVSIESNSSELLMEFQSGPNASLKPVEIVIVPEAPVESYVTFNSEGADKAFSTWSMEITDESGKVQKFGPYSQETVSIPGNLILGTKAEGDYKVAMIGQTKSGKTIRKESTVHMVLWVAPQNEEMMRFSVLYEFNNAKAITIYEKYLTEVVTPKIPIGGTVIIHGHTDIIGSESHNLELSVNRANDVKSILEKALLKDGRTDVNFEVSGFGEDQNLAPFDNKLPEERFYNLTVIIDILPHK